MSCQARRKGQPQAHREREMRQPVRAAPTMSGRRSDDGGNAIIEASGETGARRGRGCESNEAESVGVYFARRRRAPRRRWRRQW